MKAVLEVFIVFLRLGLTSFGGPVAHVAFFREEFTRRRRWLSDEAFSSTLALSQFLPGPASSQLGFAIGRMRAGVAGAFAAWVGFTLPSALLMIGFGLGMIRYAPEGDPGWLQGLRVAVVVVVAKAVWGMTRTLCPRRTHLTLAFGAAMLVLAVNAAWIQVLAILAGGVLGWILFRNQLETRTAEPVGMEISGRRSWIWLGLFALLLVATPWVARLMGLGGVEAAHGYYRSGALVFGGGHVVLPLLREIVVPPGWMDDSTFMAGYGAAQALPGPLFTISAYLGTVGGGPLGGGWGGIIALVAIFLPSWLLVLGALPHWQRLSQDRRASAALQGANAAVAGLLLAALYQPVWLSGILGAPHAVLGLGLFALTMFWRLPPWGCVLLAALAGQAILG